MYTAGLLDNLASETTLIMIFNPLAFTKGLGIGLSLIIAIGPQNAYVLSKGIKRQHRLLIPTLCALIDIFLIALGVSGFGLFVESHHMLLLLARLGGSAFLLWYALKSFYNAFSVQHLDVIKTVKQGSIKATVLTVCAISLLNPHAYLDSMVLIGAVGGQLPEAQHLSYALGAMLASVIWFYSLSFLASILSPLFAKPITWRVLDVVVGCIMLVIAALILLNTH